MGQPKQRLGAEPTQMGERILAFMSANYITDVKEFAEGLIGVPYDTFLSWIYGAVAPDTVLAKPILLCAEILGTSPEYLICLSDDPRRGLELTYDESLIVQAFRDANRPGRQKLLQAAFEIAGTGSARPQPASPFPSLPLRRPPPGKENS